MWGEFPPLERDPDDPDYLKALPGSIQEFKGLPADAPVYIPELNKNRKCTDWAFSVTFAVVLSVAIAFSAYLLISAFNAKKLHEFIQDQKKKEFGGHVGIVVIMCFVSIGFCNVIYFFMWYSTRRCFWTLIIIESLFCLAITIGLWFLLIYFYDFHFIVYAVISTACLILLLVLIFCFFSKFNLIILTIEEAMEIIFEIKILLFLPFLTFLVALLLHLPIVTLLLCILAGAIKASAYLLITYISIASFVFFWIHSFIYGAQIMIVAGSVSTYYFTRDLDEINPPFNSSLYTFLRFHTGTVAAGALLVAITVGLRELANKIKQTTTDKILGFLFGVIDACLCCITEVIIYCTQKAYIMTAMHGSAFCPSGKRARRLFWSNLLDTIAIDGLGNMFFYGSGILILVFALGVGVTLTQIMLKGTYHMLSVYYVMLGLFYSSIVVFHYMQLLLVAIGTIFLCFCEDKLLNNGSIERPYFMSGRLLEVVNIAFDIAEEQRRSVDVRSTIRRSTIFQYNFPDRHTQFYPVDYPPEFRASARNTENVSRISTFPRFSRISKV